MFSITGIYVFFIFFFSILFRTNNFYEKNFLKSYLYKYISFIKKSRLVVTHGGPGAIFLAIRYGRNKPMVVPRLKKFSEHVDNHQLYFCKFIKRKKIAKVFTDFEESGKEIKEYILKPKPNRKYLDFPIKMNKLINKLKIYSESYEAKLS